MNPGQKNVKNCDIEELEFDLEANYRCKNELEVLFQKDLDSFADLKEVFHLGNELELFLYSNKIVLKDNLIHVDEVKLDFDNLCGENDDSTSLTTFWSNNVVILNIRTKRLFLITVKKGKIEVKNFAMDKSCQIEFTDKMKLTFLKVQKMCKSKTGLLLLDVHDTEFSQFYTLKIHLQPSISNKPQKQPELTKVGSKSNSEAVFGTFNFKLHSFSELPSTLTERNPANRVFQTTKSTFKPHTYYKIYHYKDPQSEDEYAHFQFIHSKSKKRLFSFGKQLKKWVRTSKAKVEYAQSYEELQMLDMNFENSAISEI